MGEIAEDYINGACCQDCMHYFKEEHGYPVLCKECWQEAKEEGRVKTLEDKQLGSYEMTEEGYQKALYD